MSVPRFPQRHMTLAELLGLLIPSPIPPQHVSVLTPEMFLYGPADATFPPPVPQASVDDGTGVRLTPTSIEREKQNKVSHVVDDLEAWGIPRDVSYGILLKRGIFKWLAGRRDIIKLKDDMKEVVKMAQSEIAKLKIERVARRAMVDAISTAIGSGKLHGPGAEEARKQVQFNRRRLSKMAARRHYLKGYLQAIEDSRAALRTIAHSPRWRVQDNDSRAQQWLEKKGNF